MLRRREQAAEDIDVLMSRDVSASQRSSEASTPFHCLFSLMAIMGVCTVEGEVRLTESILWYV